MQIDKTDLCRKAKNYNQLNTVFLNIVAGIKKVLSGCETIIFKPGDDNTFSGFGQTVLFSWRFFLFEESTFGELSVSLIKNDTEKPFFNRYFDPKGNIYTSLSQQSSEHCIDIHEDMENLLFMILNDFYKLDCFEK